MRVSELAGTREYRDIVGKANARRSLCSVYEGGKEKKSPCIVKIILNEPAKVRNTCKVRGPPHEFLQLASEDSIQSSHPYLLICPQQKKVT
ncbi:hypothetical protein CDL12_15569 [Handroanthus impetiginosus]|uniref:Uncharacterized protein n=1 Tax=Handroanthus impetiginosus TaxID=429701 RepID=A0A2G9H2T5_9LAMI|nr:hypothetical protein CDL12_15569 [Handroanthus impetiginosus]